jgi:hypothetical protein
VIWLQSRIHGHGRVSLNFFTLGEIDLLRTLIESSPLLEYIDPFNNSISLSPFLSYINFCLCQLECID